CISKLMSLGMTLQDAIRRSTVSPAQAIHKFPELGTLGAGHGADVAVLAVVDGNFAYKDAWGKKRLATRRLENLMTVRGGRIVWDREGLSFPLWNASLPQISATRPAPHPIYDILIKGGTVIDPANHRSGQMDVAIIADKIARVAKDLPATRARKVIEASGYFVTPGLIDIHTHFDKGGASLNIDPDHNSLSSGVTTAVDAGSSGWKNFKRFRSDVIDKSKIRLLAFLNIVGAGMYGSNVEDNVAEMNAGAAAKMVRDNKDVIVGIKAAHFQPAIWDNIDNAVKAAEMSGVVVMVDFSPKPGRSYPDLILKHMRPGDIHTHIFGQHNPQVDAENKIQPYMLDARNRGILFDIGHGSGSFLWRIASAALQQGFLPDTISTDLHSSSVMFPRANLATVMSKLINLGMTLEQAIERTTVNPAKAIKRSELGTLTEGSEADVAILEMQRGRFAFLDVGREKLIGDKNLRALVTIRAGKVLWDSEGLSVEEWKYAGPYSNYK
ncbi:MAG: amidohydrolase/deacetylase family metallohydrolase, partial [Bryobacteraceae bacterium]